MKDLSIFCMALALLSGCASMDNRLSADKVDPDALSNGSGIVVMSTGAASRCTAAATSLTLAPARAAYAKEGILGIPVDAYVMKSDFPDHQGNLSAFQLKAGDYQLYPYQMNPFFKPVKVPRAVFSVAAGEVVYIGEYFMTTACAFLETIGTFGDQGKRDLDLLRQTNPKLASVKITTRLARFEGNVLHEQ